MPTGLVRRQLTGDFHFITFSCYDRRPYLASAEVCNLMERSLERMRQRYGFVICGYVLMPEHVHLLLSEPKKSILATALKALKLSVAVQRAERPFWAHRYYDFNVFTASKRTEKLRYMHRNPVKRGLVDDPAQMAMVQLPPLRYGGPWHSRDRIRMASRVEGSRSYRTRDRGPTPNRVPHISPLRCGPDHLNRLRHPKTVTLESPSSKLFPTLAPPSPNLKSSPTS